MGRKRVFYTIFEEEIENDEELPLQTRIDDSLYASFKQLTDEVIIY